MGAYRLTGHYFAVDNGERFGPWEEGEVVDLEPDRAEWINRDSPGVLVEQVVATRDKTDEDRAREAEDAESKDADAKTADAPASRASSTRATRRPRA